MIAFFDSCALIYWLEGQPTLRRRVERQLQRLDTGDAPLAIGLSHLTWLECRVGPLRQQQQSLLAAYDRFFGHPDLIWVPVDERVLDLATSIRATTGLRTPDAIQAASCLQLDEPHGFVTGDKAFARVAGLQLSLVEAETEED